MWDFSFELRYTVRVESQKLCKYKRHWTTTFLSLKHVTYSNQSLQYFAILFVLNFGLAGIEP